jgi:superfamily II DNA or RNA helicase
VGNIDMTYEEFLSDKRHTSSLHGFKPTFIPDKLFDFQKLLVEWSVTKGRCALFAACGLGKTGCGLTWDENIVRKTNGNVLILTPLAVAPQFVKEGQKFGIECSHSKDGKIKSKITIANYERLHYFNPDDFVAVHADESGCLKNFDAKTTSQVTEFMRRMPYRHLATATPSPNDFIELGTSSECLGEMGYMDMLSRFFKNDQNSTHPNRLWANAKWRFRGHSEKDFWRWVCSWARAIEKPSDIGCDDSPFQLPPVTVNTHMVSANTPANGCLFSLPATNFQEEREERRRTVQERCERVASLIIPRKDQSIAWCELNDEGDLLEQLIPDSRQVSGNQSLEEKEEIIEGFRDGTVKRLITKADIAGFGLNLQNCWHQTCFPTHSYERWHQHVRRSWRFGQKNPVTVDVVLSEGQTRVLDNQRRKADAMSIMFRRLVEAMNDELKIEKSKPTQTPIIKPSFL